MNTTATGSQIGALTFWLALVTAVLAASSATATERSFVFSEQGLGPLQRGAPASMSALAERYPSLDFARGEIVREGVAEPVIRGFSREATAEDPPRLALLVVLDTEDRVLEIIALDPRFVGPFAGRAGVALGDLQAVDRTSCVAMVEQYMGEGRPWVACPSARTDRLQFLFDANQTPPPSTERVLGVRLY
ncbi:MAG: hypothetical protein AAF909_00020 [Pseudomonadota bacterium]